MRNAASEVNVLKRTRERIYAALFACCLTFASVAFAASDESLPDPLTLEYALSLTGEPHPDFEQASAELEISRARAASVDANTGINLTGQLKPRWVEPSDLMTDRSHDDSSASIFLRKRIYDFGRSGGAFSAASAEVRAQEWSLTNTRSARRIDIMSRYFDVLIADLRYSRDYEAMSIGYVRYDQAKERQKLGQLSDIDVDELHDRYQNLRLRWYESTAEQRNARARLAIALNRPGKLPANLSEPGFKNQSVEPPAFEELLRLALETNPGIRAARERVAAVEQRVSAARSGYWPTIDAEVAYSKYERDMAGRDKWGAQLQIDIPLYSGGKVSAEVEQQLAELRRSRAVLAAKEAEVRQALFELREQFNTLRVQRDQAKAQREYRDLYLDRSRMLYDQEMRTDLGDAMTRTSEAKLRSAETEYAIALAWARLEAIVGQAVTPKKTGEKK